MDRPDLYVIARILERLSRDERAFTKTALQVSVGLNYTVFRRYLDWLVARGMLALEDDDEGREIVRITTKGRQAHLAMIGWIREIIGDDARDK